MASGVYNRGKYNLGNGVTVWGTTTIGVALVTSTYTPNADHNVMSDITNELSGGGYARGTLSGKTVTENDTNDRVEYNASKQTFTALQAAAGTPQYAIIYDNTTGADGTRELLAWVDLGTPDVPNGNDYEVRWNGTDGTGIVIQLT